MIFFLFYINEKEPLRINPILCYDEFQFKHQFIKFLAFNKWCSSVPKSLLTVSFIQYYLSNLQFSKVFVVSGDEIQWWLRKKETHHIHTDINVDLMTYTIFYFNGNRNEILLEIFKKEAPKNVGFRFFFFSFVYKWVYWWCGFTIHPFRLYNFTLQ